jgi:hypothetical protein
VVSAQRPVSFEKVDDPPRGAAYWELGGNAMIPCCTANVDWLMTPHWSIRSGLGVFPYTDDVVLWGGVLMSNYLIGSHGRYLEAGAGIVKGTGPGMVVHTGPTVTLGYRLQRRDRLFRVSFTPVLQPFTRSFTDPRGKDLIPSFGISWGVTFH